MVLMATLVPQRQHSFMSPATVQAKQGKQNSPQQQTLQSVQQSISPVCHIGLALVTMATAWGCRVTTVGTNRAEPSRTQP